MGTYTTNYNLFMPSIGEQGWGELVNGNFTTIDTTMKGMNNRIGTLETEADAFDNRITALENGEFDTDTINGVTIKTGVITVTPKTNGNFISFATCDILPYKPDVLYSGSIVLKNIGGGSHVYPYLFYGDGNKNLSISENGGRLEEGSSATLPFENIRLLKFNTGYVYIQEFTLT